MNIAIVSVLLRSFVAPFQEEMIHSCHSSDEMLQFVREMAIDQGEGEILELLDWIIDKKLTQTFFPEPVDEAASEKCFDEARFEDFDAADRSAYDSELFEIRRREK